MGKTVNGMRQFRCKSCAMDVEEEYYLWKNKPQTKKNICLKCIKKAEIAAKTQEEHRQQAGYLFRYPGQCCL